MDPNRSHRWILSSPALTRSQITKPTRYSVFAYKSYGSACLAGLASAIYRFPVAA